MNKKYRKILSFVVVLCMVLSLAPTISFAGAKTTTPDATQFGGFVFNSTPAVKGIIATYSSANGSVTVKNALDNSGLCPLTTITAAVQEIDLDSPGAETTDTTINMHYDAAGDDLSDPYAIKYNCTPVSTNVLTATANFTVNYSGGKVSGVTMKAGPTDGSQLYFYSDSACTTPIHITTATMPCVALTSATQTINFYSSDQISGSSTGHLYVKHSQIVSGVYHAPSAAIAISYDLTKSTALAATKFTPTYSGGHLSGITMKAGPTTGSVSFYSDSGCTTNIPVSSASSVALNSATQAITFDDGTSFTASGHSIYATYAETGKQPSTATAIAYDPISTALAATKFTLKYASGLLSGVTMKAGPTSGAVAFYSDAGCTTHIPVSTANSVTLTSATQTITFDSAKGASGTGAKQSIYVTYSETGKAASTATELDYYLSTPPDATKITVNNNYGIASTVLVTGLTAKDKVKVYKASTDTIPLASATVAASATSATVSIPLASNASQLTSTGGSLYVTVTSTISSVAYQESAQTTATYYATTDSATPTSNNIAHTTVTTSNFIAIHDTDYVNVIVMNLKPKDVATVYAADGTTKLKSGTVAAKETYVLIKIPTSNTSLTTAIKVEVATPGENAVKSSAYTLPLIPSASIDASAITVVKNSPTGHVTGFTIAGYTAGTVKIYSGSDGSTALATNAAGNPTSTTMTTDPQTITLQSNITSSGCVYITYTSATGAESLPTKVNFTAAA